MAAQNACSKSSNHVQIIPPPPSCFHLWIGNSKGRAVEGHHTQCLAHCEHTMYKQIDLLCLGLTWWHHLSRETHTLCSIFDVIPMWVASSALCGARAGASMWGIWAQSGLLPSPQRWRQSYSAASGLRIKIWTLERLELISRGPHSEVVWDRSGRTRWAPLPQKLDPQKKVLSVWPHRLKTQFS